MLIGNLLRKFQFLIQRRVWDPIKHLWSCSRPEVFCKHFANLTGKHLRQSLFNKVAGLRPGTLLKQESACVNVRPVIYMKFEKFFIVPFQIKCLMYSIFFIFIVSLYQSFRTLLFLLRRVRE